MKAFLVLTVLAAAVAGRGQAQDPRLRARLPPATAEAVERIVDSVRAEGLPVEPLVQKALEGRTKGASSDRIIAAVRALGAALAEARRGLGARSTIDELQAGVLWLRAGGSLPALERLRAAASGRSLAVPLAVSSEFLGRGWPAPEAVETLETLLRARITDAALLALRRDVDARARGGDAVVPALRAEVGRLAGGEPVRP